MLNPKATPPSSYFHTFWWYLDQRFSSNRIPQVIQRRTSDLANESSPAIAEFIAKAIAFTENPDHARLRRLVNGVFSKECVESCRPSIVSIVDEILASATARGEMEVIGDLAAYLPIQVLSQRIGLPSELQPALVRWTHDVRCLLDPSLMGKDDFERVHRALVAYKRVFQELIAERRAHPGDDMISQLLEARAGEDRLSNEEVVLLCIMTFVAGSETTTHLIGNGALAMLRNPDQIEALRRDPALIGNAVDEMLRFDTPLQQTKHAAVSDVAIAGQTIREGEQVLLLLGAANRDPAVFPEPDRFLITRQHNVHLGLGYGMRACLGGYLAHLQAQIACDALFRRAGRVGLVEGPLEWQEHSVILRGLKRLPVTLTQARRP